jgi:hypothetical protein
MMGQPPTIGEILDTDYNITLTTGKSHYNPLCPALTLF